MNLYDLHSRPETLKGWEQRFAIPELAYNEALRRAKYKSPKDRQFSDLEPAIASDPELAYSYAANVVKGRFPEAEPFIAKDRDVAMDYARDIIGGFL